MDTTMHFDATWDATTKVITLGALSMWLVALFICGWLIFKTDQTLVRALVALSALPGLLAVPLIFLWSPRHYELDGKEIRIIRMVGVARIELKTIRDVREVDDGLRLRRDFGSGGLFGFFGAFSESNLGKVTLFGTRNFGRVAIVTDSGTVLLTPDTTTDFVSAVKRACG